MSHLCTRSTPLALHATLCISGSVDMASAYAALHTVHAWSAMSVPKPVGNLPLRGKAIMNAALRARMFEGWGLHHPCRQRWLRLVG